MADEFMELVQQMPQLSRKDDDDVIDIRSKTYVHKTKAKKKGVSLCDRQFLMLFMFCAVLYFGGALLYNCLLLI